jgi:hypothetical protein
VERDVVVDVVVDLDDEAVAFPHHQLRPGELPVHRRDALGLAQPSHVRHLHLQRENERPFEGYMIKITPGYLQALSNASCIYIERVALGGCGGDARKGEDHGKREEGTCGGGRSMSPATRLRGAAHFANFPCVCLRFEASEVVHFATERLPSLYRRYDGRLGFVACMVGGHTARWWLAWPIWWWNCGSK